MGESISICKFALVSESKCICVDARGDHEGTDQVSMGLYYLFFYYYVVTAGKIQYFQSLHLDICSGSLLTLT